MTPLARDEALVRRVLPTVNRTSPTEDGFEYFIGCTPDEVERIEAANAALARIVGQARDYEKALLDIRDFEEDVPLDPSDVYDHFQSIARAALGAGGTDNERTAEEVWITERTYRDPEGGRTAGTGPTADVGGTEETSA